MLASLLTMRSFAEEERSGSLELLLTSPVRLAHVVAGKLGGVLMVFGVVVAGTLVAPLLVAAMGDPDGGPIVTGYLGLLLAGVAFLAVGLAASAATPSQLVASATSAGVLLGLWFVAGLAAGLGGRTRLLVEYVSPSTHVTGFLRGTISAVDVTYFLSLAVVGAGAAIFVARARR
jgi:ABC-2 type transport system permease protein